MSASLTEPTPTYTNPSYSTYTRSDYVISTDPARLDPVAIHAYLTRAYWATGRPLETVELSLRHSLNFGLYHTSAQGEKQIGLARIITDYAIFAYLCDVYVLEDHRGHGLGKWLIETMCGDPALKSIRRFMLATRDAHGLYGQFGFVPLARPENWMEYSPSQA